MRFILPLTILLFTLAPAVAQENWDDALSLDGSAGVPKLRHDADGFSFDGSLGDGRTAASRYAETKAEYDAHFYGRAEVQNEGFLRDASEFRRQRRDPAGDDRLDTHWTDHPSANPYVLKRNINRRVSPMGFRESNDLDAYVAPGAKPLTAAEQRTYRTGGWTSAKIRARLNELYGSDGRGGCCGE